MILSKAQTKLLDGFICSPQMLFAAPFVTNSAYNALCDEVLTWQTAEAADDLYGTRDDNTTFKYGIDQFPVPTKR